MNKKSGKETKNSYLQLRLQKTLKDKLEAIAAREDRSVSNVALQAIKDYLERQ